MATWHIIPNRVNNIHERAAQAIIARRFAAMFESQGFTVAPLPERTIGISVSHSRSSAMSLFLLKHDCTGVSIHSIS